MGLPKARECYGDGVPVVVGGVNVRPNLETGNNGPQGEGAQAMNDGNHEGCGMQSAEVVLGVLRERGRRGLPCTQLYRQMFNKDLYLLFAYGNIYSNEGR